MLLKTIIIFAFIGTFLASTWSQVLDKGGVCQVDLDTQLRVVVMPGYDDAGLHTFYYLPVNLRLSTGVDGVPEFNFMTYRTSDGSEIAGAIFNFLLVWGLTSKQEKETEMNIRATRDSLAVLAGVVSLELPVDSPSFLVYGDSELAQILRSRWSREPVAPVLPNTKIALSYRLTADEAKVVQEAIDKPALLKDVGFQLNFKIRGGNKAYAYNLIKGDYYSIKANLKDIFASVIGQKK